MQMNHKPIATFLVVMMIGCSDPVFEDSAIAAEVPTSTFNLKEDLFSFSSEMTEFDTVYLLASLSVCTTWGSESNVLTKGANDVFVKTFAEGEFVDSEEHELEMVKYDILEMDTLSFENFFQYLTAHDSKDKEYPPVFTVIHKDDTLKFYSEGLVDRLIKIDYYLQVKRRIYPDVAMYQPELLPENE
jgi:hypothetical protein